MRAMTQVTIDQALALAGQHKQAGRLVEADAVCRLILAAQPNHSDALNLLGAMAMHNGRTDKAIDLIRRAIAAVPGNPTYHFHLGLALQTIGQLDAAIATYQQALNLKPDYPEVYNNLGLAHKSLQQYDKAIECFRRAITLQPNFGATYVNLGNVYRTIGQTDQAMDCYRTASNQKPPHVEAFINLGHMQSASGLFDEAIITYRQAIQCNSALPVAHFNLGIALMLTGQIDDALASCRHALALDPTFVTAHDNIFWMLHYHPDTTLQALLDESQLWNRRHAQPLRKFIQPHANDRDPDRRLRVGYLSPSFCNNPIGRFMAPLLASHDHASFEIFCYSQVSAPDDMTSTFQSQADVWRDISGQTDQQVADMIRRDNIDILVDLVMHGANNRALVFARKPAPVQVGYLASLGGTGLDTIDYRLTDRYLNPDDSEDKYYLEKSMHLPGTYWCYQASTSAGEVNQLPALTNGRVTMGCLNDFAKVSTDALHTWSTVLTAIPTAHLILHSREGSHRRRVVDVMTQRGVAAERLEFVGHLPPNDYFNLYHRLDIALDPFPYAGGTTTCDALWMGVPVVTLAGRMAVGRAGVSILSHVGVPQWIAHTRDDYVRIATDLAADLPRLAEIRATLRQQMRQSPLMDADRFARDVESAYRSVWRTWCQSPESR